jgi:predicted nucleotidyltransferase
VAFLYLLTFRISVKPLAFDTPRKLFQSKRCFMPDLYSQLAELAARYGVRRLVLFGSRARGDNHPRSDVDLAAFGLPPSRVGAFRLALEELPTLLKFDFVAVSPDTSPAFLSEIEKDGVTLYESSEDR